MLEVKYKFRAKSPLYTGAGTQLGFKSELRKQKIKIANPTIIKSKFKNIKDRENALIDVLAIMYSQIDPGYRMKRRQDIWKEFKSSILSACGSKSISNFLTRFATRFDIGSYDTIILKYLDLFSDAEFLQYLPDNIDYLLTKMRLAREGQKDIYNKIKQKEKEIEGIINKLEKNETNMFYDDTEDKLMIDKLYSEQKELELSKTGFIFDIENYKIEETELIYQKDFENVPLFTGNTIGGIMRRLVMADYLKYLGVDKIFDFTYHTLFTGGSLTEKVDEEFTAKLSEFVNNLQDKIHIALKNNKELIEGESGVVDIAKSERLAVLCPPIRLFGTATKGGMISSELIINNARLICKENGNGDTTLWSLIEDIFNARHDSAKTERNIEMIEVTSATHQMKFITETLIAGTEFEHSFILKSNNTFIENCFHAALVLLRDYHHIGGRSARGLGDIDMSELNNFIDIDKVLAYYKNIDDNKQQIMEYLGVR